jgi:hypothetical protein
MKIGNAGKELTQVTKVLISVYLLECGLNQALGIPFIEIVRTGEFSRFEAVGVQPINYFASDDWSGV